MAREVSIVPPSQLPDVSRACECGREVQIPASASALTIHHAPYTNMLTHQQGFHQVIRQGPDRRSAIS
jgi:hypothetical protein